MLRLIFLLSVSGTAFLLVLLPQIDAQARFITPVSRASAFRDPDFESYNPPVNYDDHRVNCGNVIQEEVVGGNCGLCGDPFSDPAPRRYEMGGSFYRGFFTGVYMAGSVINVAADVQFSKQGYMEWRLCDTPLSTGETQACFNKYLLQNADGSGSKTYVDRTGVYTTQVRLPAGVRCAHCVIQWNYRVANNWGMCPNGTGMIGCGAQETFRACSDVMLV